MDRASECRQSERKVEYPEYFSGVQGKTKPLQNAVVQTATSVFVNTAQGTQSSPPQSPIAKTAVRTPREESDSEGDEVDAVQKVVFHLVNAPQNSPVLEGRAASQEIDPITLEELEVVGNLSVPEGLVKEPSTELPVMITAGFKNDDTP